MGDVETWKMGLGLEKITKTREKGRCVCVWVWMCWEKEASAV